jgi:hypothetical protein
MGAPLTIVILVAAGGASEPATLAIERATSEALGRDARVIVRESTGPPSDGEALAVAEEANGGAVVEVAWGERGHRVATLRLHLAGRPRWTDRTIGFRAADADSERGRTLGFALASMLPEPNASLDAPFPAPAPAPTPASAPMLASAPTPAPAPTLASAATPATASTFAIVEIVPPWRSDGDLRWAVDLFGLGATALGGQVQSAGGGAALETFLFSLLSVRIGGAVRAGELGSARARTLILLASAGLALHPWRRQSHVFGAALRVDYVMMNQSVTPFSATGADLSTRARLLSGVDALVETEWRLGEGTDLLAGAGIEEMLATTYVDLNGHRVATVPGTNFVAEAGLRLRF